MTNEDLNILLKYLIKTVVPPVDHDAFIKAVERLEALRLKAQKVA
jgi:hypothetical protein